MRVAFDSGGTFTDVIAVGSTGEIIAQKVLTPSDQVARHVASLLPNRADVLQYLHATTVPSNALIEGKTAKVGLITTAGFRDVLEMRGQKRPPVYDINWDRLPPLVPRRRRQEVTERTLADGTIDRALDPDEVVTVMSQLVGEGVEAIAVCLINSYANPEHERLVGAVAAKAAPWLPISLSSEVFREAGEYERTSTACVNAGLMPVIDAHLKAIEELLLEGDQRLLVMGSHGGFLGSQSARHLPAQTVESGPAAGVLAGWHLAAELNLGAALCFDMGGTTAKAALVDSGKPLVIRAGLEVGGRSNLASRLFGGEGHAARVPTLDVVEVGAGGGSVAWIDQAGSLRVGPRGAGAHPGPACYGLGGKEPTVTDASVVLGVLNPKQIAGGAVEIFAELAARALHDHVASKLGLSLQEAAFGVLEIADATIMRALRAVTVERGRDPREVVLIAYGGAGPLHAARLATMLGIKRVVIPPLPGLFSALGLLVSGYRYDASRSLLIKAEDLDGKIIDRYCAELEATVRQALNRDGVPSGIVTLWREADMRYRAGTAVLTLSLGSSTNQVSLDHIASEFVNRHRNAYGFVMDSPVDVVAIRVRAEAVASVSQLGQLARMAGNAVITDASAALHSDREVFFGKRVGTLRARVLGGRSRLGAVEVGPLIIEEPDTTILVPPGWRIGPLHSHSLLMTSEPPDRRHD